MSNFLESINFGQGFDISMIILLWSLILGLIVGLIWFIWWLLSYNQKVMIMEPIGEPYIYDTEKNDFVKVIKNNDVLNDDFNIDEKTVSIIPTLDTFHKAKIVKLKGTYSLKLLFPNKKLMLPKNVYQAITKKGKKSIKLVKINEHTYMPSFLSNSDTGEIKYIIDESYYDWFVTDMERDQKKFISPNFWEKYGMIIFPLIGFLIGFIIIMGVMKMAGGMTENMTKAAEQIAGALTSTAEALKDALESQVVK